LVAQSGSGGCARIRVSVSPHALEKETIEPGPGSLNCFKFASARRKPGADFNQLRFRQGLDDQRLSIRAADEILHRTFEDQFAPIKNRYAVADVLNLAEQMRRD
jgi:hypothetical protein